VRSRTGISGFVVQEADGFGGVRILDGMGDGAIFVAEFATRLIAVEQRFCDAAVADHFVAQVPRDALRTVAPEDNSLLQVDDTQAGGQAIDTAATDVGVVK
jgi:hypothetical protein